jgi:hypothetical protein
MITAIDGLAIKDLPAKMMSPGLGGAFLRTTLA